MASKSPLARAVPLGAKFPANQLTEPSKFSAPESDSDGKIPKSVTTAFNAKYGWRFSNGWPLPVELLSIEFGTV